MLCLREDAQEGRDAPSRKGCLPVQGAQDDHDHQEGQRAAGAQLRLLPAGDLQRRFFYNTEYFI